MSNVCSITYIAKNYPGYEGEAISKLHMQIEGDFRATADGAIKASSAIKKFVPSSYQDRNIVNKAIQAMNAVNRHYGDKVVHQGRDTNNKMNFYVNVSDAFERQQILSEQRIKTLIADEPYVVIDGEIFNPEDAKYQRKAYNLEGTPLDTLEGFFTKAKEMQEMFLAKGIDVYVMLDGDQEASGEVLSDTNSRVLSLKQQGIIGNNTKVISVNPNILYEDVIHHEFGHLFIDAIGGLDNTRVASAFTKLVNTEVYNEVVELYPELDVNSDKFKKEVIATALGREANQLFKNRPNEASWWQRFADWLFGRIQNLISAKDKDNVAQLAKEFLTGEFTVSSNLSPDNYFRKNRAENKLRQKIRNRISNIEEANNTVEKNIRGMIENFQERTGAEIFSVNPQERYEDLPEENKPSLQAFILGKIKTIGEAIQTLNENQNEKFILSYVNVAIEGIERNLTQLDRIEQEITLEEDYDINKNIKFIQSIILSNGSFALLEKLNAYLDNFSTDPELKAELSSALERALGKKNKSENKVLEVARKILVDKLTPLTNIAYAKASEDFEVEYNTTKGQSTSRVINGETKQEFVQRMLNEEKEDIEDETKEFLAKELVDSIADIGSLELMIRSEVSINSTIIQIASKIMKRARYNETKRTMAKSAEAQPIFEEYFKKYNVINPEKLWKPVTQEVDGIVYLKSKYDFKFLEEFKEISAKLSNVDSSDINEARKVQKEYDEWINENTLLVIDEDEIEPVRIPKSKWLNKEYAAIMKNPNSPDAKMLKFLESTLEQSDKNYKNKMKLIRSPFGNASSLSAKFYRMPALGKDTLEKTVDGNYLENAKDSFERLYQRKDDDLEGFTDAAQIEEDEMFNSKLSKKVLANALGQEKHSMPIFYRGKYNTNRHTKDVMTAVLQDHHMSIRYAENSEILPLLDLITVVTEAKEYGDTAGFKNVNKEFSLTKEDQELVMKNNKEGSNEYKKLKSMIENQIYNVTTIESEAAKIAQTVMAWTGSLMMSLNIFSGIANVMQGKVMNFLESVSGTHFDKKNLTNGEKKFFADMGGWMDDLGKLHNYSKTRLMIDLLNVQGDFLGVKERYIRSNKGLALASRKSLTAPNAMGEFYVQGTLMYSIMDNIKVKGIDGNYLDKDFKSTKDKSKAISLDEAITTENGTLKLHPSVFNTTFSFNANGDADKILSETRNFVKKVSSDLHGQYDKDLQAHAQREIWGKFLFMFRKWIVPGFDKRWRGTANVVSFKKEGWQTFEELREEENLKNRFFSEDLKQFQEGRYTTFIRMISSLVQETDATLLSLFSMQDTKVWNQMTDAEKGNVRQTVTEIAVIALTLMSAHILKGLAADLPEDDLEYKALMVSAFAARRLHMEMAAYGDPMEAYSLMKSPAASLSLIQKSGNLVGQFAKDSFGYTFLGEDFERYERGELKDTLKLQKYFMDLIPVVTQTNRNITDVTTYVFN